MTRQVLAGIVALFATGCEDVTVHRTVDRIPEAIATPSFRRDIAPILEATCASSGACHGGASPAKGLGLSSDRAYADLVNVPSAFSASMMRVRPGQPDSSFAFRVLADSAGYRLGYYRMPLTQYPVSAPIVETIRNWIIQGAREN